MADPVGKLTWEDVKDAFHETSGGVSIDIEAIPGARRSELSGYDPWRKRVKVRVAADAIEGRANRELVAFFSRALEVPERSVSIARGEKGRQKTVRIENIDISRLRELVGSR